MSAAKVRRRAFVRSRWYRRRYRRRHPLDRLLKEIFAEPLMAAIVNDAELFKIFEAEDPPQWRAGEGRRGGRDGGRFVAWDVKPGGVGDYAGHGVTVGLHPVVAVSRSLPANYALPPSGPGG